ncbi:hypothetical protein [Variovorax sp. EL159]|uniref:hypothetical protein n=1 Tax=Variovorax sp. EL159 TaxID=1566270 RepID=UPI00088BF3C7|nr:hypothetical protein [Variovorax sp. EL159]SCX72605.1 hypothetical protein SAMN03159363_4325 [Variovorax sp. EL159]
MSGEPSTSRTTSPTAPRTTPRTRLVLTVELAVFDEHALARAARACAREDGLSEAVWASMRVSMCDDLIMLLDPGLVADAGFEIIQSMCEVNGHAIDQH